MSKGYGAPYKGSKNRLAKDLSEAIPSADNFYDLFAGGCSVTHRMLETGSYKNYFANDLDGQGLQLFMDAISGKYKDEKRWISREDFYRLKDTDLYVSYCWSFGNKAVQYLYSKEIEPWKKALHYARVYGDFSQMEEFGIHTDGSFKDINTHQNEYKRLYIKWWLRQQGYSEEELEALIERCKGQIEVQEEELRQYLLKGLESSGLTQAEVGRRLGTCMASHYFAKSQWGFPTQEYYKQMQTFMPALDKDYNEIIGLHNLWQRLESLESLESLQRLEASFMSYDEVKIKPDSVIYCDPPYRGTDGYKNEFNHERFYDWCTRQKELVLISEYAMPKDRFTEVWNKKHRSLLSATTNKWVIERLYVPTHQLQKYKEMMLRTKQCVQLELFSEY